MVHVTGKINTVLALWPPLTLDLHIQYIFINLDMRSEKPIRIFIAYSQKDTDILDRLRTHLSVLERNQSAEVWYDGLIESGKDREQSIKDNLHRADIILLIISHNFIASDFNYNKETAQALTLHDEGKVLAIPVIAKPCLWNNTPFAHLQVLPKNGKPITSDWGTDKNLPYQQIAEELESIITEIRIKQKIKEQPQDDNNFAPLSVSNVKPSQPEEKKALLLTWWELIRTRIVLICKIGIIFIALITFIFLLTDIFNNKDKTVPTDCTIPNAFDENDTTALKILILHFNPDRNFVEIEVDYRRPIIERLKQKALDEGLDIKLIPLDGIEFPDTDTEARYIAKCGNADMVIWGYFKEDIYGETEGIRLRYTLDKDFEVHPSMQSGDTGMQSVEDPDKLRQGNLQQDINYIIHFTFALYYLKINNIERSLELFKKTENDSLHVRNIDPLKHIINIYIDSGNYGEGIKYAHKLKAIEEYLENGTGTGLAYSYNILGEIYEKNTEYDSSIVYHRKAINILKGKKTAKYLLDLAIAYNDIGIAFQKRFETTDSALIYQKQAIKILIELPITPLENLSIFYNNHALTYLNIGKYDTALTFLLETKTIQEDIFPENHPNLAITYGNLGITYSYLGAYVYNQDRSRLDTALQYLKQAIAIQESVQSPEHPTLGKFYNNIAVTYSDLNKYDTLSLDTALMSARKAIRILSVTNDSLNDNLADAYNTAGLIFNKLENYDSALVYMQKALHINLEKYGEQELRMAMMFNNISTICIRLSEYGKALKYLTKALPVAERESHVQLTSLIYSKLETIEKRSGLPVELQEKLSNWKQNQTSH